MLKGMAGLVEASKSVRIGNYEGAIRQYVKLLLTGQPQAKLIEANLRVAVRKYRESREGLVKPKVAVSAWSLGHNPAGRAYTLATLYQECSEVDLIGCFIPRFGTEVWEPIRDTAIRKHSITINDETVFLAQAMQFVAEHPYDIVHLSKPRFHNILLGILYKVIWRAKVIVDIDDEELGFVGAAEPLDLVEYLKSHSGFPKFKDLHGELWTRLGVGSVGLFDGITVCNEALQAKYGGTVIRHARDTELIRKDVSKLDKKANRVKYGMPVDKQVVLFFGTPRNHKGLLETAKIIAETDSDELVFLIVGDFADKKLKQQIESVHGCQTIFLPGQPVDNTAEILALADFCVLLQEQSSVAAQYQTPAKISDALSAGVPVLTCETRGIQELVKDQLVVSVDPQRLRELLSGRSSAELLDMASAELVDRYFGLESNRKILQSFLADTRSKAPDQLWYEYLGSADALGKKLGSIDIVIPVYNALEDVKKCLDSIVRNKDGFEVRVIIVNDASEPDTSRYLRRFCSDRADFCLIEHEKNMMYTRTVNDGLRMSEAEYVITLNSDTIVTKGWLDGLVRCMKSSQKIGIVGPLSNAASWQNVPALLDENKQFAVNELPLGFSADDMAGVVKKVSSQRYPRLPFVNGFCLMMTRKVIDTIGYLDEENFPTGYGEENDYCIRALDAGFELAIADDTYVYHAKSKSFGHEKRKVYSRNGSAALKKKHTEKKFLALVEKIKDTSVLDQIRSEIVAEMKKKHLATGYVSLADMKVLFLLPVKGGGGGAHSVVQEVAEMRRLGFQANVAVKRSSLPGFLKAYEIIPDSEKIFVGFDDSELISIAEEYDVVVATIFSSMRLVKDIVDINPHILPAYYVQDYEPFFFKESEKKWKEAFDSYSLVSGACLFAKTRWIIDEVWRRHSITVHKVYPSIDHDVYKPASRSHDGFIHISVMVRPGTPRRGAERSMRVLSRINNMHPGRLKFHLFGCEEADQAFQALQRDFDYTCYGVLKREEVAKLLARSDIFLDLSDYQAFGRTALEAMACGCTALVPAAGGASEYALNRINSIVVDTENEDEIVSSLDELLSAGLPKIRSFQAEGLLTAARYSVHQAAISEYVVLALALNKRRVKYPFKSKRKIVLLPSLRADGVAAGSGFVRVVLPFQSQAVQRCWRVQIGQDLPVPGTADVVVLQRDMAAFTLRELEVWGDAWRDSGGKVVYEIDDDLFDVEGLQQRGFQKDPCNVLQKIKFIFGCADLVLCSTENLAKKARKFSSKVHVIPNCLDARLWRLDKERSHAHGEYRKIPGGPIRIGYIGTPTHDQDLDVVTEAMNILQEKYGDRIEIEVIGGFQRRPPTFGKRVGLPKKNDYPSFVNWLFQRVHWDIGIIPLVDDGFNESKSYLKFLEYAALDMAIVVSDVLSYREVANNRVNCLSVTNDTESWVNAVSSLIEDESLRKRLAVQARHDVVDSHAIKDLHFNLLYTINKGY